jgi:hypothetical protein
MNASTHSTHSTHSPRPIRRILATIMALSVIGTLGGVLVPETAQAAKRRVRPVAGDFAIAISPDSIRVDAGGVASFPVTVRSAKTLVRPVFDVEGLPNSIDAEIERVSSSRYRLDLFIPANAPSSNAVYTLIGSSGRRNRTALFRLEVVGRAPVTTAPPVTAPPLPPTTTTPPVIITPVPQPVNFGISLDKNEFTASTDEQVGIKVNVDRSSGYAGPVQFTLLNAPKGMVAGYLPNPTNGGTALYLTPKPEVAAGRYVMTIVGTAGSTQKAVLVALTVKVTGEFAMLASPTSVTRTSAGVANYVINVGTSLPVRPVVSYSVEGVPGGASAKFNVNDTDKSPTLSVTTTAQTPNGTYNLTITGRSGSVVKQIQVQLVVNQNPVGFTTSADNDTVTIPRGQTRQIILTIRPSGGFAGTIATGLTGLPTGVSLVSLSDAVGVVNQPVSIVITLAAAVTAPTTTSAVPVSITSSSGAFSSTIKVNVNVT